MPTRTAQVTCQATFSSCRSYRYTLTRTWDSDEHKLLFVMLNPSYATEVLNDSTVMLYQNVAYAIARLADLPNNTRVAEMPQFGSFRVCNLYAWIATDTTGLRSSCGRLIGPRNDDVINASCEWADHIVCAWGGSRLKSKVRRDNVKEMIRRSGKPVWRFNCASDSKQPCHPLAFRQMDADLPENTPAFHKLIANLRRWHIPADQEVTGHGVPGHGRTRPQDT